MHTHLTNHDRQSPSGPHYPTSLPKVQLEIVCGQARHKVRPIEVPVFLIGTADDCDMVLGDPRFPEAHMYLLPTEEGVSLRWLGVGPEVTVGGRPVDTTLLQHDDCIRTAQYEFRIHIQSTNETRPDRRTPWRQTGRGPESVDSPDTPDALQDVRCLLEDIRNAVFPQTSHLRLYVEPETPQSCDLPMAKEASADVGMIDIA